MSTNEDSLPNAYKYAWNKDSETSLEDFLARYKPSLVQNDGSKPWIWVKRSDPQKEDQGVAEATTEAKELLNGIIGKVEGIKNDASIPLRSNKKIGAKSKKEVREEVQSEATERLKAIAIRHGYVSGKWLIFTSADKVDMIWSNVAASLVSGPLSSTSAYLAKVATSPESETPNYQHIICVYIPDVYDKEKVTDVMRVLLRNHGVTLSGVKANLYTSAGIDSKHPSGIQSTVWKNTALMKDTEIKELKDAFFAESTSVKTAPNSTVTPTSITSKEALATNGKAKPKPTKVDDDPFVSDDDTRIEERLKTAAQSKAMAKGITSKPKATDNGSDSEDEQRRKHTLKAKKTAWKAHSTAGVDNEDDAAEEEARKQALKVKKGAKKTKRSPDDEDEDGEPPKKKRGGKW
ncbi:hypothetical protein BDQ12DRAFT_673752 [Crucibulum laeve]|uniref:DUF1917-domain-containing protein n=1 Tax=Crucibulum laeve TaxID=68775 RepID=A0A5C3MJN1_9AGAR|nr:hypothetical protein BDQ12DRAFT_673752 [Crucibulum laeve]